jgi:hypothetical protein
MLTKIDLCSQALLKIGENAIASFNDDCAAAKIAKSLYDTVIDALISGYNWRFATKKYQLRRTESGGFPIPSEILRVIACSARDYEIAGNVINAKADAIEITASARVGAESFPPYFAAAAATRLAMEFCVPLTGNQNMFALLNALYESELRTARFIDSTTATPPAVENFPLITARF